MKENQGKQNWITRLFQIIRNGVCPQGEPGPQGEESPQCPQAPQSEPGHQGEESPQCPQAPQGEPGPQGEERPQGPQAPQGEPGPQRQVGDLFGQLLEHHFISTINPKELPVRRCSRRTVSLDNDCQICQIDDIRIALEEIQTKLSDKSCEPKKCCSCHSWVWLVFMVFVVAAFVFFLFMPTKAFSQTTEPMATINSVSTNIPITLNFDSLPNNRGFVYAHHIKIDSIRSDSTKNGQLLMLGEIEYRNTHWYYLLYYLLIAGLFLISIIFLIRKILPYWAKCCELKLQQEKEKQEIIEKDKEYARLQRRIELSIYEKGEKARIDEWQRDQEHIRKIEIKEQERITELSRMLLELARIKNTITLKGACDNGKTIIIERSILSDDCCAELKSIVENFSKQTDDCCCIIKALLKFLLDNPDCCEKIKKILNCLFCCDKNERKNADITAAIERLIAIVQSHGTSGVQQVVNLGGNSDSSSNHTDDCTNMIISILKNLFNDPVFSQKIEELIKRQSETKQKEGA